MTRIPKLKNVLIILYQLVKCYGIPLLFLSETHRNTLHPSTRRCVSLHWHQRSFHPSIIQVGNIEFRLSIESNCVCLSPTGTFKDINMKVTYPVRKRGAVIKSYIEIVVWTYRSGPLLNLFNISAQVKYTINLILLSRVGHLTTYLETVPTMTLSLLRCFSLVSNLLEYVPSLDSDGCDHRWPLHRTVELLRVEEASELLKAETKSRVAKGCISLTT